MSFDREQITPKLNNWFSTNIEYQGNGVAKFLDPEGEIQGNAIAKYSEFSESNIELIIEKYESTKHLRFGYQELVNKSKPVKTKNGWQMASGGGHNPCRIFRIETSDGSFTGASSDHYGLTINNLLDEDSGGKITFYHLDAQFNTPNKNKAKYWVLPLSNFVSDFRRSHPYFDSHPLRIYPTPRIPDNILGEDRLNAAFLASSKNQLIHFILGENAGFIEPLPDYNNRKDRLLNGKERNIITSFMVGEIEADMDIDKWEEWGAFDFLLLLLGFASGAEVGAPWIEFRDSEGELLRRIHKRIGRPTFSIGREIIDENFHSGMGYLLSKSKLSQSYNTSTLRVVIRNLIQVGLYNFSTEDRMRHLSVALDNLCEEYKINKTLSVSQKHKAEITAAIKYSKKVIDELTKMARKEKADSDAYILGKISGQISAAKIVTTGFGEKVVALVKKFNLPDAEIMENYYKTTPRSDKRKRWQEVISFYRGVSMHKYITKDHDFKDTIKVLDHLHDILIRIVLNILGYDGTYQPPMKSKNDFPVDWVKPDTKADELGY